LASGILLPDEVDTPMLDQRPVEVPPERRRRVLRPDDIGEVPLFVAAVPLQAVVQEMHGLSPNVSLTTILQEDNLMTREEMKFHIQGPIATVPTPFDDKYEIDYGLMYEMTQWWVEQGLVAGRVPIKVAAAMGEGPSLRDDEWPYLLRTVVNAAKGKASILCGIQYKDTIRAIEDAKRAQDLGAVGLQIGLPIFQHPTQDDLYRYFAEISEAIDIGIMLYNTYWYGCESVTTETLLRMKDIEHLVAVKWNVPEPMQYEDMAEFSDHYNVICNSNRPVDNHKMGGRGYINLTAEIYPPHDLKIWELLEAKRYDEAGTLFDKVNEALRDFADTCTRSGGQSRVKKALMKIMGHPVGDPRPPSMPLSDDEMARLGETMVGLGWPVPSGE